MFRLRTLLALTSAKCVKTMDKEPSRHAMTVNGNASTNSEEVY